MSAITIGGDLIHYEKLGRGRPVILVHGWIGSWRYWIPLMQTLHTSFSVYTLDLIGFGDSSKNSEHYTIDKQVEMMETFLEQLGIPKAAMIGHGLGSLVVLEYALRNPDKVARMMLNSMPLFDPGGLEDRLAPGMRRQLTPSSAGGDRYSLSPNMQEIIESDKTVANSGNEADKTIASSSISSGIYTPFHELPTVGRPDTEKIDREALKRAAEERQRKQNAGNPLNERFNGQKPLSLLASCFDTKEPEFGKLKIDVEKSDARTLEISSQQFEAGETLDNLHKATMPILLVHGENDKVLPPPTDPILTYIAGKNRASNPIVPVILEDTRHFPMLEHNLFARLTNDFLTKPDISKIELRGIWKRRSY